MTKNPAITPELRRRANRGGKTTREERRMLAEEIGDEIIVEERILASGRSQRNYEAERRAAALASKRANDDLDVWEGTWRGDDWKLRIAHEVEKLSLDLLLWAQRQGIPWGDVRSELLHELRNL